MSLSDLASAGFLKISPSAGLRPPGMNTSANPGLSLNRATERAQSPAITGDNGKPPSANAIAGARSRASGSLPNLPCNSAQPSTQPGTLHEYGEYSGMVPSASGGICSAFKPSGERPQALRPYNFFVFGSHTIANRSPPMPFAVGSMSPRHEFMAIAASTAEPPAFSTSSPAWAANGCAHATMPC